jgi:23S rRNA A1618 N6-methylase RlmF
VDIAHDVIIDPEFDENWRKLLLKHIYKLVKQLKIKTVSAEKMSPTSRLIELKYPCQGCENEYSRERYQLSFRLCNKCYYDQNKDRINANNRRWKSLNREKVKESNRLSKLKIKNQVREYNRQYKLSNKEAIAKKAKIWREANREKIKENRRQYYLKHNK